MMKKYLPLVLGVIVLAVLGWYTKGLLEKKGKSDTERIDFAVKEVDQVDQIIITDPNGNVFELHKNRDVWTDKDGGCIQQQSVHFILDAFRNIQFKGYLPKGAVENMKERMAAQHTKVEIFSDGEWLKTWYIGPEAQDHYGQIMLLETEDGSTETPVIMEIKGVYGIISPRFFADARKWMCTEIFSLDIDEINEVNVQWNTEPSRSFKVVKNGADLKVYQQDELLQNIDTAMVFRYLNNYKKIHYEMPNYILNPIQIDSLKKTTPFVELTVTEVDGHKTHLRMFRIKANEHIGKTKNEQGEIAYIDIDQNRFWLELPNGQIVKAQYFVFNPLILGHIYFPMNEVNFKTVDGIKI